MTPKEKAEQLVDEFLKIGATKTRTEDGYCVKTIPYSFAQTYALITVDEIVLQLEIFDSRIIYWKEVRHEIENL